MTEYHENDVTPPREPELQGAGDSATEPHDAGSASPDLSHHVHELPTSKRNRHGVRGLFAGLRTTATSMTQHAHTRQYPEEKPDLPARSRGAIALLEENCTVCMLCARECPDWCLYIDSHKETVPAETEGGRDRQRNVLDRFAIDFSLCMYCGICIEACPFDALFWTPEFEYASSDIRDLLHEKDTLAEWMLTVPAPDDLDERAPEAAEVTAASKPPRVQRRRVKE